MESVAKLKNSPFPARKMRLLADLIRGEGVDRALDILKFHNKQLYSRMLSKLLLSAIANWKEKHGESALEEAELYVKTIAVDNARQLKRIQPRAQGRAYVIRKRSSHISIVIGNRVEPEVYNEDEIPVDNTADNDAEVNNKEKEQK